MTRHTELRKMAEKSIEATKIHHVLLDIAEAFQNVCGECGGLPPGLPPQVYDDQTECQCQEE
ncbi:hypothetical protein LCGC14_0378740 [marine sediment metagenome]|uniref:Uncharacterized protein n=1 Tax=marine sediment metagenome TaxID=412755 RepID=A0A0F9VQ93_9ZZZZ